MDGLSTNLHEGLSLQDLPPTSVLNQAHNIRTAHDHHVSHHDSVGLGHDSVTHGAHDSITHGGHDSVGRGHHDHTRHDGVVIKHEYHDPILHGHHDTSGHTPPTHEPVIHAHGSGHVTPAPLSHASPHPSSIMGAPPPLHPLSSSASTTVLSTPDKKPSTIVGE